MSLDETIRKAREDYESLPPWLRTPRSATASPPTRECARCRELESQIRYLQDEIARLRGTYHLEHPSTHPED